MPLLISSFCLGLICIYILGPEMETVIVHPLPGKTDNQYKDANSNCFVFNSIPVECPSDAALISKTPYANK